jgi:hypothetical protein
MRSRDLIGEDAWRMESVEDEALRLYALGDMMRRSVCISSKRAIDVE